MTIAAEALNVTSTKLTSAARISKSPHDHRVPSPLRLFLSYAHVDHRYIAELRKDLKLMERNGLIIIWSDHALTAGEKWKKVILQKLKEADVIICQLSRDFLYSDFCTSTELDIAIKRKNAGEAELIAYVLRDCGWEEVPTLAEFVILPRGGKHLRAWPDKDGYWRAVAKGIQEVLEGLLIRNELQGKTNTTKHNLSLPSKTGKKLARSAVAR